jgi:hypothetical protein
MFIYHICCWDTECVLQPKMVNMPSSWSRLTVSSGQFFDEKFRGLGMWNGINLLQEFTCLKNDFVCCDMKHKYYSLLCVNWMNIDSKFCKTSKWMVKEPVLSGIIDC